MVGQGLCRQGKCTSTPARVSQGQGGVKTELWGGGFLEESRRQTWTAVFRRIWGVKQGNWDFELYTKQSLGKFWAGTLNDLMAYIGVMWMQRPIRRLLDHKSEIERETGMKITREGEIEIGTVTIVTECSRLPLQDPSQGISGL